MFIPFNELADHSRLWIYQADRPFTKPEENLITQEVQAFCEQWEAHGQPLRTSFFIDQSQFLILAVDEGPAGASGCSIDGSVRMLKSLQDRLGIDFLGRSQVPFLMEGAVRFIPVRELKQSFASGILGPSTKTFHLLAATKGVWEKDWILPVENTWMIQYLTKSATT